MFLDLLGVGWGEAINARNEYMVLKQNPLWFFKQILIEKTYAVFFKSRVQEAVRTCAGRVNIGPTNSRGRG